MIFFFCNIFIPVYRRLVKSFGFDNVPSFDQLHREIACIGLRIGSKIIVYHASIILLSDVKYPPLKYFIAKRIMNKYLYLPTKKST